MSIKGKCAIAGLGVTAMGKVYGRSATDFAAEAINMALEDAGLKKEEVDGLLINANMSPEMSPLLQMTLGFEDLSLLNVMNAYGSTAGTMIQYACMAIEEGLANVVALVYADDPLKPSNSASSSYSGASVMPLRGMEGLRLAYGSYGANPSYALAARRHMHLFGTTSEQLGAIAISQRKWAQMNPWAQMRKPLTMEDYLNSRYIVEPFHLFDCCLVSNGGIAVIITSAERAKSLKQPPVYVLGMGQAAPGDDQRTDREPGIYTGAKQSARRLSRWRESTFRISTSANFTTATPTLCLLLLRITVSVPKVKEEPLSRMASSARVDRCPPILVAENSRHTICGASRRFQKRWCRRVGKVVNDRSRRTISSWSVATEVFSITIRQRFWVSTRHDQYSGKPLGQFMS